MEQNQFYFKLYYSRKNYEGKIRIFGRKFVENNKNKCKIIYKNKVLELKEYFEEIDKKNCNRCNIDLIKIKLIAINKIADMSEMFNS